VKGGNDEKKPESQVKDAGQTSSSASAADSVHQTETHDDDSHDQQQQQQPGETTQLLAITCSTRDVRQIIMPCVVLPTVGSIKQCCDPSASACPSICLFLSVPCPYLNNDAF